MPTRMFPVLSALVSTLLVTVTDGQTGSYYITLEVESYIRRDTPTRITFPRIRDRERFQDCVCSLSQPSSLCQTTVTVKTASDTDSKFVTQADTIYSTIDGAPYYVCSFTRSRNKVSCIRQTSRSTPYNTNIYSVSVVLGCSSVRNVTLVWATFQKARVINSHGVTLVNCCQDIQTTTAELTPTIITSSITNVFTIQPTTNLIDTTSTVDTSEGNTVQRIEDTSLNATLEYTSLAPVNKKQQDRNTSTHISGAHIGITVGTGVCAVLLTICVMLGIWKWKSRHGNHADDVILPARSKQGLEDRGNISNDDVKDDGRNKSGIPLKYVARISPLNSSLESGNHYSDSTENYTYIDPVVPSHKGEKQCNLDGEDCAYIDVVDPPDCGDQYNQTTENYTYIDPVGLRTANLNNISPDLSADQVELDNYVYDVASECSECDSRSDYTQFGEKNVILENPYNCLPPDTQNYQSYKRVLNVY